MAMYDIPRDDTAWVNTIGYDETINSELERIESGNLVEATVTDTGGDNEYWNLLDIQIARETALYYIRSDGYTYGPTDDFWDEKEDDEHYYAVALRDDDKNVLYEVHVQEKTYENDDGEERDVYTDLMRGELISEPLFSGNACNYIDDGAEAVIVVNPEERSYLVTYIFPSKNEKFNNIWKVYSDRVGA
jgi:hypothetical protein